MNPLKGQACLQTFIKRMSKHTALEPDKKLSLHSGSSVTFGALKCRVTFGPSASEVGPVGLAIPPPPPRTLMSAGISVLAVKL